MKILAVEDEQSIARIIKNALEKSGHLVDVIDDGIEAQQRVEVFDYDVIILDIMLPGADGFDVCRHVRDLGLDSKIIMLTAKDDLDSKIAGLNIGADDYLTKPFSIEELEARIRALSRREKLVRGIRMKANSLILDTGTKIVTVNNKQLKTTLTEFRLIEYLMRHKDGVCTRTMLMENVWGNKDHISNVMNATISKLRAKIRKLNNNEDIIHTVPKSGYRIY
jgi:DNA-binding response OmpR family regulator